MSWTDFLIAMALGLLFLWCTRNLPKPDMDDPAYRELYENGKIEK